MTKHTRFRQLPYLASRPTIKPLGGQHEAPRGLSTTDPTDRERDLEALADFEAEWERLRYRTISGREW